MKKIYCVLGCLLALAGCKGKKDPVYLPPGERETILLSDDALKPNEEAKRAPVILPAAIINTKWAQAGGTPTHAMPPLAVADAPQQAWKISIGAGSASERRLLSEPIIVNGQIYTLDAEGTVTAHAESTGQKSWEKRITPGQKRENLLGGGLAYENHTLYVTSPFAEVLALNAESGDILWRTKVDSPIRAAPTVSNHRVFAININNELMAFEAGNGEQLWTHIGITESAGLLGGASPAVYESVVVVPYSSGEVYALNVENGLPLWSDSIASFRQVDSVSALAHIRARPVIDRDLVFLISHSGRISALNLHTGTMVWNRDVGGIQTPAVGGDFIFAITNNNEIVCLTRQAGHVKWARELPRFENPKDSKGKILWNGPVIANHELMITGSNGQAMTLSAETGEEVKHFALPGASFIPPVIANKSIYYLTDNGYLSAWR